MAIDEINMAIDETRKAAVADGKNIESHPPVDSKRPSVAAEHQYQLMAELRQAERLPHRNLQVVERQWRRRRFRLRIANRRTGA